MGEIDVWEGRYRLDLVAIFGTFGIAVLSGYIGGSRLSQPSLERISEDGAAVVGLVVSAAIGVGLRSGARGGPLSLELADVHHVLLAPIGRRWALLGPALRQLQFASFVGLVLGAVSGNLASQRFPGPWLAWVASGVGTGTATAVVSVGAALVASGLRAGRWAALAAALFIGWSVVDVIGGMTTSPATLLGQVALLRLVSDGAAVLGVAFAAGVAAFGLTLLGGVAIVQVQQRSALAAQLRFALTMQDVRTVVLLRRLLSQEGSRARPWFRFRMEHDIPSGAAMATDWLAGRRRGWVGSSS